MHGVCKAKILSGSTPNIQVSTQCNLHSGRTEIFVVASSRLVYQMHNENKGRVIKPVFTNSLVSETKRYPRLLPPQDQREGTTNTLEIPTCRRITSEIEMS